MSIVRHNEVKSWTIADSAATSDAIVIKGMVGGGFRLPASTEGATVTFEVSEDGSNFVELRKGDADEAVTITVTSAKAYPLPDQVFGWNYLKIKTASNQTGVCTIPVTLIG